MIELYDLINKGFGGVQIIVTLNDLQTFATSLPQGRQNSTAEISGPDDELMTRQQVMVYLKIKETTLYNWGKQGLLMPRKINRKCYYNKKDILALQRGETKISNLNNT
ncbi:MAG: helix-turn-helix domain-containing protein [Muribaculaceae bacterium]|nr:helix-turn-helix domain-containing protein [Muribaculaceae bacterium]